MAAIFVLVATATGPAAQTGLSRENAYTVSRVAVDARARNAAAARVLAMAAGHEEAFNRLILRLVPRDQLEKLPPQTPSDVTSLVRNFEVDEEKTSSVRYLASLTFRFDPFGVRGLLKRAGISFAESRSRPMLVLPVYRVAGAHLLWDKPNPWRESWAALPESSGLVPLIVPRGDLADIAAISADQAALGEEEQLQAVARRYRAGGVILALATLGRDRSTNELVLQVTLTRYGNFAQDMTMVRSFTATDEDQIKELMALAASSTAERIQEDWKTTNLLRFDRQKELVVRMRLSGLADWVAIQRTLAGVSFVQSSNLVSLSRGMARVRLNFLGNEERLGIALAERNLSLKQGPDSWELSRRSNKGRRRAR